MNAMAEAKSLKADPLPSEGEIVKCPPDYSAVTNDNILGAILDIDQQVRDLQNSIRALQDQRTDLLNRALKDGIKQDRTCDLVEIPGKNFRVPDVDRFRKDWPQMWEEAVHIEKRKAMEKVENAAPTLKTLETVCGKKRVDDYCTTRQGPSTYEIRVRGRY